MKTMYRVLIGNGNGKNFECYHDAIEYAEERLNKYREECYHDGYWSGYVKGLKIIEFKTLMRACEIDDYIEVIKETHQFDANTFVVRKENVCDYEIIGV